MEEGRGGSLETGLDRSERIETCFDRFKRVNLNGLKRVSTGFNEGEGEKGGEKGGGGESFQQV
jgi:hypothetical protein